jgi:UDP-N-acetylglucosamine acyltransferase
MATVHPTAILEGEVHLAEDVVVGPYCVLTGPLRIGAGTRLIGNVYLHGPLSIGERNLLYPFVCVGFPPQSVSFDPGKPGCGVQIGRGNTFREGVTIHRAMTDAGPTTIGDGNYFMTNSHAGHDCVIASGCIVATDAILAGHVRLDDRVNVGGGTAIHQFVRIGRGAMLSGGMGTGLDVLPFFMLTGINIVGGVNLIGMRRMNMSRAEIDRVRWAHRLICREGLPRPALLDAFEEHGDEPIVREFIDFIRTSKRGYCTDRGKASRGTAHAGTVEEVAATGTDA